MFKTIAKYVSQSVFGMIGVSLYILADTFFIAKGFGADGLAVLNLTIPVYGLIYAIGQMLGLGFAVVYSLRKSTGSDAEYYFFQAVTWGLILSLPFILIGIFTPDGVLKLLGADAVLAEMGKDYLRLVFIGSPLFMCNYVFTAFARNDHATGIAMVGALVGSFYNIVFDYVFMFPLGLGFKGAALATVTCPLISMLICLIHFLGKKNTVGFRIKPPEVRLLLKSCSLGVSGFIGEFSNAVTSGVFNFLMLYLGGNVAVAAYGIITNIALVCICIFNGIAQGLQPLMSQSFAQGKKQEAEKILKVGLVIAFSAALVFVAISFLFTDPLVSVFNSEKDAAMAQLAGNGMRLYFTGFLVAGINIVLIGYYSATGKALPVFVGSMLRGVLLISAFAVGFGLTFGMNGVWLSFLASEAVTIMVLGLLRRRHGIQKVVEV